MRTTIYVDGLNLYYRCLRKTEFKWLDLILLFTNLLDAKYEINRINYYYTNVKVMPDDPKAPERQDVYLKALNTLEYFEPKKGDFSKKNVENALLANLTTVLMLYGLKKKGQMLI